jgi:hypothetical protein
MTKNRAKVLAALSKGEKLTLKQIGARFKVANPSATISDLRRRDGANVVFRHVVSKGGSKSTKYMLASTKV